MCPKGNRIKNQLKKANKNFLIYSSWSFREVNFLLKSKLSQGHIYIEEGQATYMNYVPYSYKGLSIKYKFIKNWKNRINVGDGSGYFYRDDAHAFLGMFKESYPKIQKNKIYILNNFESLKKFYNPKIIGVKKIGITRSASRLKDGEWEDMLKILIKKMNFNGMIKPHPSFTST